MTDSQRRLMRHIDRILSDPRPIRIRPARRIPLRMVDFLIALERVAERANRAADEILDPPWPGGIDPHRLIAEMPMRETSLDGPLQPDGQALERPYDLAGAEERYQRAVAARRHATLKGRTHD